MKNNIVKIIIVMLFIINLIHISGETKVVYGVPRNLAGWFVGGEEEGNYTLNNETIPENILYLLQRLEELKNIVSKYNSTLAGEINNIEIKLLSGDYEGAFIDYYKLQDDLQFLSRILKDINPEDYIKLVDILNENLENYMASAEEGVNINDVIYSGIDIDNISSYEFNMPNIDESPLNPPSLDIGIPSIHLPSAPNIDNNLLYTLAGITLVIAILITMKKYGIKDKIGSRIKLITFDKWSRSTEIVDNPAVRTYYKFLDKCRIRGEERNHYEGPLEHAYRISSSSLRNIGIRIAAIFEKVRYGYKNLSVEEINEIDKLASEIDKVGVEKD